MVRSLPANAGDTVTRGLETFHMPQDTEACAPQLPSPGAATAEAGAPWSLRSAARDATATRSPARKLKTLLRLQKARAQQLRPSAVKKKKKKRIQEFPGGSVVGNSKLPLQGAQVRSLMGELRPYKLHRVAKKKKEWR